MQWSILQKWLVPTLLKERRKGAFFWRVIAHRGMKRKPSCDLEELGVSTKGKWIACVFPHASLNIGTQKSFRREIMLRCLQSKWDSLHENKFIQILGCEWVCVFVLQVQSLLRLRFLAKAAKCLNVRLMSNLCGGLNVVFCKLGTCPI